MKILILSLKGIEILFSTTNLLVFVIYAKKDDDGSIYFGGGNASSTFATMVFCGYLYLSLVQVVGAIFGDDAPVQDVIISLCGFIFYLAIGTEIVDYNMHNHDENIDNRAGKVIGSMSIVCCTIYFIDSVICIIKGITRLTK